MHSYEVVEYNNDFGYNDIFSHGHKIYQLNPCSLNAKIVMDSYCHLPRCHNVEYFNSKNKPSGTQICIMFYSFLYCLKLQGNLSGFYQQHQFVSSFESH